MFIFDDGHSLKRYACACFFRFSPSCYLYLRSFLLLRHQQSVLQEQLSQHQQKISDITKERDALARQLSQTMPQDYTVLSKELNIAREHMLEKDEEIAGKSSFSLTFSAFGHLGMCRLGRADD